MRHPSPVAEGLRAQGRRTPVRSAVTDGTGTLTFDELDALVGTLARRLLEEVDGDPTPPTVPVLVGRDRWAVVALHAAFRAGVPCAPLDPSLPPAMLAELTARLGRPTIAVVGDEAAAAGLPTGTRAIVVPRSVHDPVAPQAVDPAAPAVVVFTSGSTGRPKGVVLDWSVFDVTPEHYVATADPDEPAARLGVTAPLHWVGGLRRVLATAAGSSVALMDGVPGDPAELLTWLDAQRATQFAVGPALAAQLAGVWEGRRLERVDLVILGGDVATGTHVETLRRLGGPRAVVRYAYSATESGGVNILCRSYGPDDEVRRGPLPLGAAAAPGRARFAPVDDPSGELREIVARGTVARGYIDDPELTADRFGVDPDGTRWWRSGDLVRVDPGGDVWHAGRLDDTVKINGKLVAPAESELVLRAVDGVRQVAVVPYRGNRRTRLVAHVQVADDAGLSAAALRASCAERLAPHVVPAVVMRHDRLPTTTTGKADRVRLAEGAVHPWRSEPARAPTTDLERWLLAEVRRVVELDDVGPDDDLVAVGMDSLAAVELCAALAAAGHDEIDPAGIFDAGTVAAVCHRLEVATGSRTRSTVVAFHEAGTGVPVVALPGGGGTATRFRFLAEAIGPERPVLVVEPRAMHRHGRPDRTVPDLAAHVVAEIDARLDPGAPVVVMGYSASGPVAYEAARRLLVAGRPVHLVLLDTAPSLRSVWVRTGAPATVRTAVGPQLPGAVVRSVAYRLRHLGAGVRRWRLERFPGPARFDVDRYMAFQRIMVRAGRAYDPVPAPLRATLVHVGGEDLVTPTRRVLPDVDVRRVGGDHGSMLEPPHVAGLATVVDEIADAAFADPPR